MKINCVIVDDEPASRDVLKKYIADTEPLVLVKECKNAFQVNEILREANVDLMFLDINMPKISGIQLLKSLTKPPKIIFTTAYPQYAIEGFELDAVDYLLKPFSFERFLKGINKYSLLVNKEISSENQTLFLKSEKKLYRIAIQDVVYLEAVGDYVKVVLINQSIIVHSTFQHLLEQFADSNILRIHRSFAIAMDKFEYIDGNQIIVQSKALPVGKAYRQDLMLRLGM